MLSKNTCEGIHLTVKLATISLQACKFTKVNFFTHIFHRFLLDLLFFVFSRNDFMEGCFTFQWGEGEEGVVFQMGEGGFIFKWGCAPWGASVLMGGGGGVR